MSMKTPFTIVIPVHRPGPEFEQILKLAIAQDGLYEIILLVSRCSISELEIQVSNSIKVIEHPAIKFNHGLSRNLLLAEVKTDFLVFLTQDSYLSDRKACYKLVEFTKNNDLAGCYGRQLPRDNAGFCESFLRRFNYGAVSYIESQKNSARTGFRKIFSSNSFCCYDAARLNKVGGFRETNFGEDALAFLDFLKLGLKVGYSAESSTFHSHKFVIMTEFRRNFEIGKFRKKYFREVKLWCGSDKTKSDFLYKLFRALFSKMSFRNLVETVIYVFTRITGYTIGRF